MNGLDLHSSVDNFRYFQKELCKQEFNDDMKYMNKTFDIFPRVLK